MRYLNIRNKVSGLAENRQKMKSLEHSDKLGDDHRHLLLSRPWPISVGEES